MAGAFCVARSPLIGPVGPLGADTLWVGADPALGALVPPHWRSYAAPSPRREGAGPVAAPVHPEGAYWSLPISYEWYATVREIQAVLLAGRDGRPPHPVAVDLAQLLAARYSPPI